MRQDDAQEQQLPVSSDTGTKCLAYKDDENSVSSQAHEWDRTAGSYLLRKFLPTLSSTSSPLTLLKRPQVQRRYIAANAFPLPLALVDVQSSDVHQNFHPFGLLGQEVQLEAALHVPGVQAAQCVQAYGSPVEAPELKAGLQVEVESDNEAQLAACLATPMEGNTNLSPKNVAKVLAGNAQR